MLTDIGQMLVQIYGDFWIIFRKLHNVVFGADYTCETNYNVHLKIWSMMNIWFQNSSSIPPRASLQNYVINYVSTTNYRFFENKERWYATSGNFTELSEVIQVWRLTQTADFTIFGIVKKTCQFCRSRTLLNNATSIVIFGVDRGDDRTYEMWIACISPTPDLPSNQVTSNQVA